MQSTAAMSVPGFPRVNSLTPLFRFTRKDTSESPSAATVPTCFSPFTVRKTSYGVGVEKTFLVHSPAVEKVEVTRVGKARRAKLFYLRDRLGKSAKTREKIGARIETKEVTIKEELVEEAPVSEEAAL